MKHPEGGDRPRGRSGGGRPHGRSGRARSHERSGRLIVFDASGGSYGLGADGEGEGTGSGGRGRATDCRRAVADGGVGEAGGEAGGAGANDGGGGAFAEGFGAGDVLFSATPLVKPCTGCFGCWTRTPGVCVLRDRCTEMPRLMARCETLALVSPLAHGGFSRAVKAVLDRAIGYVQPFFRIVEGEMHHVPRYEGGFRLEAHFYGPSSEPEREVARRLVRANAVNYYAASFDVRFHEGLGEAKEALR